MSDLNNFIAQEDWPRMLAKALPLLLTRLLDPKQGESLERLQLINVEINFEPRIKRLEHSECADMNLSRSSIGHNNFLTLEGLLTMSPDISCKVGLTYFVRGQRKYFKHDLSIKEPSSCLSVQAFTPQDIQDFFASLGQANTFFHDQALSELNGRSQIPVPNQLIITKMLDEALAFNYPSSRFAFTFCNSVFIGQDLKLSCDQDAVKLQAILYANNEPAIVLHLSREAEEII